MADAPREITLDRRAVRYVVRRSARARRLRLRIVPGRGLEVVLPRGATLRDAEAFLRQHADWALRALERQPPPAAPLADGAALPFLGRELRLCLRSGPRAHARRDDGTLTLTLPGGHDPADVAERWFRAEARCYFAERVALHAAALGATPSRVAIKDTRTRWGSCSSKGNLNFSWRLLLAPPEVADYVAAHEVAHLRELNHSPRFWALVATLCPDYAAPRRWLREHGAELARWPG